ncbi:MAG: PQQ-binding-like beta-propeller repeat protein [Planctomycetaceae bacterium]
MKSAICSAVFLLMSFASEVQSADWPWFRGQLGNSSLARLEHPAVWNESQNIAWTADLPGGGWSSPVVSDGRVFVTTASAGGRLKPKGFSAGVASMRGFFGNAGKPVGKVLFEVHCMRLTDGRTIWSKPVVEAEPPHRVHPSNTYATESPVAVDGRVYTYFASIGIVACLDHDGEEVWRVNVGAFPTSSHFGTGSSLAFDRGRLFLQCDNQTKSFLLAIDCATGKELWRVNRSGRTSWSSPLVWQNHVRTELVVCGSTDVTSYSLNSGKVLWRLTGINGSFSASPAADRQRVYFGNSGPGRSGPLVAVNAGAAGELTAQNSEAASGVAWVQQSSGPGLASPVSDGQFVYVTGRGILSVYNATTGERVKRTRLQSGSSIAASPWIAGDRLFILDEAGNTQVMKTGRNVETISTNSINGLFWSTPSIAGPNLLLREAGRLYCVRGNGKPDAGVSSSE